MTRVIIVDDQPTFRQKLRQMLGLAGLDVIGEADDIPGAERLAGSLRPDLALVDFRLPGASGLEGTPRLKSLVPQMRVFLISAYTDQAQQLATLAKAAGAEAFIPKDDLDLDLIRSWLEG